MEIFEAVSEFNPHIFCVAVAHVVSLQTCAHIAFLDTQDIVGHMHCITQQGSKTTFHMQIYLKLLLVMHAQCHVIKHCSCTCIVESY